jgi:hypothetical protein
MKLGAVGLGAAGLALAVAAFALATRGGSQNTPAIITVTQPSQIGAVTPPPVANPTPLVPAAKKPVRRAVHRTPVRRCNGDASDPTGSDTGSCSSSGSSDNQAGDRNNDSSDNQAGDGKAGGA